MIEIIGVKDLREATQEELDNLRKAGFLPEIEGEDHESEN